MIYTRHSLSGMFTAPHHLAAEAGADILRNGGNAVEAMVAAAATIAVVYPHMNSIGGDGFWLISEPGKPVRAIEACGPAATNANLDFYAAHNLDAIPARGPLAALTIAGTVAGWQKALEISGGRFPLESLLAAAIDHARNGIVVTKNQADVTVDKWPELGVLKGFADNYAPHGIDKFGEGVVLRQSRLANSLEQLTRAGLEDFYKGDLARTLATELKAAGSPLALADFENFQAREVTPLTGDFQCGQIYNTPPPTQGVSSLMILGLFEKLGVKNAEGFEHHHGLIEAVKQAFILRNARVGDPDYMSINAQDWLQAEYLDVLRSNIDRQRALKWPHDSKPGDTIWMGSADREGRMVSFIQSIYWEYGSGVVVGDTGIVWQNRGTGFTLDQGRPNSLGPGRRPFHTLNPALARLNDGKTLAYGTMGGEGQPQTQALLFSRHVLLGRPLQEAITAPRWLLGRTWGQATTTLKLERRFDSALIEKLAEAGHELEIMADFTSLAGHAGAVSVSPNGVYEGAGDPRGDGCAVAI